jgi:hypothetical protein
MRFNACNCFVLRKSIKYFEVHKHVASRCPQLRFFRHWRMPGHDNGKGNDFEIVEQETKRAAVVSEANTGIV